MTPPILPPPSTVPSASPLGFICPHSSPSPPISIPIAPIVPIATIPSIFQFSIPNSQFSINVSRTPANFQFPASVKCEM